MRVVKTAQHITRTEFIPATNCSACCCPADGTAASGPSPPGSGTASSHRPSDWWRLELSSLSLWHFTRTDTCLSCYTVLLYTTAALIIYLLVLYCASTALALPAHLPVYISIYICITVYTCTNHSLYIYVHNLSTTCSGYQGISFVILQHRVAKWYIYILYYNSIF